MLYDIVASDPASVRFGLRYAIARVQKQKLKSLARFRPVGKLPWLAFGRVQPHTRFSRGSIAESMHWMVLHRPVELAAFIRHFVERWGESLFPTLIEKHPYF